MLKKSLFLLLLALGASPLYAQSLDDIQNPKIVPPSPDAAALGKYGQLPVDKSTGIPSIDIPIYEIKTPRFSLPVSLSYHASGIKVEEQSSWVGAGWSLNSGGMITRSIVGLPDDLPNGFAMYTIKKASQIQWPADMFYIADVLNKRVDTDPDNFFYNFNGHSGAFVFGEDKKPVLIPYQPIKINLDPSSRNFGITDEHGNIYSFNTQENVVSSVSPSMSGISTWYLTKVVSADYSDTLTFQYAADSLELVDYSFSFSQSVGAIVQGGPEVLQAFQINSSNRRFNPVRIRHIVFNGGKVDFIPRSGRLDYGNNLLDSIVVYNQDPVNKKYNRLKSFKLVTDYFYSSAAAADFYGHAVPEKDKYRLKLTGLQEIGSDKTIIKRHQFDYNPTQLPNIHSFAQDRWGYYNGHDGNRSLLEAQTVTLNSNTAYPTPVLIGYDATFGDRSANRSASSASMQACVLNKITYPTGGYTTLAYDCHKYPTTVTSLYEISAAGVSYYRESDVKDYTPTDFNLANDGNKFRVHVQTASDLAYPYVKVIRFSDGVVLYNSLLNPTPDFDITVTLPLVSGVHYQLIAFAPHVTNSYRVLPSATIITTYPVISTQSMDMGGLRVSSIHNFNADGSVASAETYAYGNGDESGYGVQLAFPLSYKYVKNFYFLEHQQDQDSHDQCYYPSLFTTIYSNSSTFPMATLSGSPMAYPTVTVYHGEPFMNTGKSIYDYNIYPDSIMAIFGMNLNVVKPVSVMWKNGEPIGERHYRNTGNNQYTLAQSVQNTFSFIPRKKGVGTTIGYVFEPVGFRFDFPTLSSDGGHANAGPCVGLLWGQNDFYWYDYPISTGNRVLTSSLNTQFSTDGTGSVSTTTTYYYDNHSHMFPTRIITDNSKGESLTRTKSYPQDMVAASKDPTGIYTSMTTANILSPTIEQYESKNSTQLLYEKTTYGIFNANMYKPRTVELQTLSNPSETRLQYDYDTRGNVSNVVKDAGPKIGYRWGYNKKYPIAEVDNAASNEFYYEGFEENAAATKGNAHTGQYYYPLTNYTVTWSLPNTRAYVISYWYSNAAGVWSYMPEQPFTGTITLSGKSGYDDIRIYPKDAQMKTYTYSPLVGVTSETNAGNKTAYYRYDNVGRLKDIRDQDGNILKTFQYNYQHINQAQ